MMDKGYNGIIVTDHFFNGNTCVPEYLPWKERVDMFTYDCGKVETYVETDELKEKTFK